MSRTVQYGLDYVLGLCKCLRVIHVHRKRVCNNLEATWIPGGVHVESIWNLWGRVKYSTMMHYQLAKILILAGPRFECDIQIFLVGRV